MPIRSLTMCCFLLVVIISRFCIINRQSKLVLYFRSTPLGMYEENCGLDNVLMTWGHDGECSQYMI